MKYQALLLFLFFYFLNLKMSSALYGLNVHGKMGICGYYTLKSGYTKMNMDNPSIVHELLSFLNTSFDRLRRQVFV